MAKGSGGMRDTCDGNRGKNTAGQTMEVWWRKWVTIMRMGKEFTSPSWAVSAKVKRRRI